MNYSALPLPPQILVVGNTTQKRVSKVSYREVKAAVESGGFRQLGFLEAAFDQRPADRELRERRLLGRGPQRRAKLRIPCAPPKAAARRGQHTRPPPPRPPRDAAHH